MAKGSGKAEMESKNRDNTTILALSEDILLQIFDFLPIKELCIVCRVCRSWRRVANDNSLWRHVDLSPYKLNLKKTWTVIRSHFSEVLLSFSLSGAHIAGSHEPMKNSISAAQMKELQQRCPNIHEFRLSNHHLTQIDCTALPVKLTTLKLEGCYVPPDWFMGLAKTVPSLQVLSLQDSAKTSDSDCECIAKCVNLTSLNLTNCYRVGARGIKSLAKNLCHLTELRLKGTACNPDALHHIGHNLLELETLSLGATDQHAQRLDAIAVAGCISTLKKLRKLDLSHTDCNDHTLNVIRTLNHLVFLDVSHTRITPSTLSDVFCTEGNLNLVFKGIRETS